MKVYGASVKVVERKKFYVRAKSVEEAQKALTDKVTMKRIKSLDTEITYGDMSEVPEHHFPDPNKKKVVKKATKKKVTKLRNKP